MSKFTYKNTLITREEIDRLSNRVIANSEYEPIRVTAPMAMDTIGEIPKCTPEDVETAVQQVRNAQQEWESYSVEDRATVLRRFADLLEDNRHKLLDLVQLETGKSRIHAAEEFADITQSCEYYAARGPKLLADSSRTPMAPGLSTATVTYSPYGVVGVISPWNYPLILSIIDAIPALLAGNGILLKPDEKTPYSALKLAELLERAGVPSGLCMVVTGPGAEIGSAVIDKSDYLVFTGGTETGKIVAEQAGRQLTDSLLELGGKNPFVVLEDADIKKTARGAVAAAFSNAGQLCLSAERFYVVESRFDEFVDEFVKQTEKLTLGTGYDYSYDIGSLIGPSQLTRVEDHVEDARSHGATVLTGGKHRDDIGPFIYEPTILTSVDESAELMSEETFGPVVFVESVSGESEAIEAANESKYGLIGSVWTTDTDRGAEVARQIDCGTVCINDGYIVGWAATDAPMGGFGESGMGYRHGKEGLYQYTQAKTIAKSNIGPFAKPSWVPNAVYGEGLGIASRLRRKIYSIFP
ncbi:succinate-semialdehyde dehydrogenase (NADP(+)) [Salinarchaeum sp. IM2453]|uniref:succinic semialdehyde dehydrogenase n=1 Tax=Salinarchaeum sp. IM2453 TaxID=2862870 RepID=UPI001C839C7F|nr:succinic semialdehyde dehydrogenase [Salinarchaeum sp. IM2453]QZA89639.1 succinate-semialdehyde dehydrogenase (NADP(+)) [Salinarchaeum sp. IM2453]